MIGDSIQKKVHKKCLICGNENPWSLGLNFQLAEDGWVYSEFQAHDKLQGYDGILHGGVISSLLDSAMTNYLFFHNIEAVTGELLVRFLHPIDCTSKLIVRASALLDSSPLYIVNAEIIYEDKLMARAEGKFMQRYFLHEK